VALNFDAGNQRRIELECTFHTFTAGNLTNGESRVQTAVANGDDHAFESLNTLAGTFNDVDVNDNGVAGVHFREGFAFRKTGNLFFFKCFNQIHFCLQ